jgi:hypothetical protein
MLALYRVALTPETRVLEIDLDLRRPSASVPARVWVLDASGALVGLWTLGPDDTHLRVVLGAARPPGDPALYVGVSYDGAAAAGPVPANSYALRIARLDRSEAAAAAGLTPAPVATTSLPAGPRATAPAPPAAIRTGERDDPASESSPIGLGQAGEGLLPRQSAGPSWGVLGSGRSPVTDDRRDPAVVDLALVELPARGTEPQGAEAESEPADPAPIFPSSPGGLPLAVSVLPGIRPAFRLASRVVPPPVADRPGADLVLDAQPVDRSSRRRRTPMQGGLALAAALAFGLLLPDLVAALQPISPRRPVPRIGEADDD